MEKNEGTSIENIIDRNNDDNGDSSSVKSSKSNSNRNRKRTKTNNPNNTQRRVNNNYFQNPGNTGNRPIYYRSGNNRNGNFNGIASHSLSNQSTELIITKFYNRLFIPSEYLNVVNQGEEIHFTVCPNDLRLRQQGIVYSDRILMIGEIDFKVMLGGVSVTWRPSLNKYYIYSYYKCLLLGINHLRTGEILESSFVVLGHAILYRAIVRGSFLFIDPDVNILYKFSITDELYDSILEEAKTYPFIKNFLRETKFGFELANPDLDRYGRGLATCGHPDMPLFYDLSKSSDLDIYLTRDNFPLLNSFYSESGSIDPDVTKWHYAFKSSEMLRNYNTYFGKACFISGLNNDKNDKYFEKNTDDDKLYLVKYEVQSLCGKQYYNPSEYDAETHLGKKTKP